ncbi:hypothetical protein [Ralstonia phage RP31]|uniref:Uncharacterized protein n=1 Tax=Ralstonia phage RP31 TaxID=1923890 RepID=A0A1L7N1Z4_9CAUD|nr:hypothetical protein [Ralstonia phage RP31]
MNETELQNNIESGELLDEGLQEQSRQIDELQGSLEALAQAVVADEPAVKLSEHQQQRVNDFKTLASANKNGEVLAVADKAAVEAYVDNDGKLHPDGDSPYALTRPLNAGAGSTAVLVGGPTDLWDQYGPGVMGAVEVSGIVVPSNEGFAEITAGLFRKIVQGFGREIPIQFKLTAKALNHYVEMSEKLRARLLELRPLLEKREFPLSDVFDYGAYSRFFQVDGKPISGWSAFEDVMTVQNDATRHVLRAADSYSTVVMEKLLAGMQMLQATKKPDAEQLIELRDSIERHWLQTWKEAEITTQPGQTPQSALNAFPDRKFVCLASLLDNRYLVAHAPKNNGGSDPQKITAGIRHYGASLVFDKKAGVVAQTSMNVPNVDELLKMVDQVVNVLHNLKGFEALAKKNDSFAKDFQKAMDVLNKQAQSNAEPQFLSFAAEYFKIANAVIASIQQPYAHMAWMYVRCAMVVVSLVELSVLEDPKDRAATSRFFIKQNTEMSNPALESYVITKTALQALQRFPS